MKIGSILILGLVLEVSANAQQVRRRRRVARDTDLADISEEVLESGRNRILERYLGRLPVSDISNRTFRKQGKSSKAVIDAVDAGAIRRKGLKAAPISNTVEVIDAVDADAVYASEPRDYPVYDAEALDMSMSMSMPSTQRDADYMSMYMSMPMPSTERNADYMSMSMSMSM